MGKSRDAGTLEISPAATGSRIPETLIGVTRMFAPFNFLENKHMNIGAVAGQIGSGSRSERGDWVWGRCGVWEY